MRPSRCRRPQRLIRYTTSKRDHRRARRFGHSTHCDGVALRRVPELIWCDERDTAARSVHVGFAAAARRRRSMHSECRCTHRRCRPPLSYPWHVARSSGARSPAASLDRTMAMRTTSGRGSRSASIVDIDDSERSDSPFRSWWTARVAGTCTSRVRRRAERAVRS